MEDIKDVKNEVILFSWVGRLNTVRMSVLLNLMYRFNTILIKISASYVVD